jgi:catechol 2,3-dioxygenase-like lactoylglutathione lyase family enzyme
MGAVVEDLDVAADFFLALGFELDGRTKVEGEVVDNINGLDGVRAVIVILRTPDGSAKLELAKYHSPAADEPPRPLPANTPGFRHMLFEVDDVNGIVADLREKGFGLVGEVQDYGTSYRLVYVRGPEGLIIELAEKLS